VKRRNRRIGLYPEAGVDRSKAQGDERSASSGFPIAESGVAVAGPGL